MYINCVFTEDDIRNVKRGYPHDLEIKFIEGGVRYIVGLLQMELTYKEIQTFQSIKMHYPSIQEYDITNLITKQYLSLN